MTLNPASTISRRNCLGQMGSGLASIALAQLLAEQAPADHPAREVHDLKPRQPMLPARATRVIQLFMHGGPSQMDLLDPKPALEKYDGKTFPGVIDVQQPEQAGGILKSPRDRAGKPLRWLDGGGRVGRAAYRGRPPVDGS